MRIAIFPAMVLLASCSGKNEVARPANGEPVERAKAAAGLAFERLSGELGKAIAEGGPVHAIPVCSSMAGSLTASVADELGLEMVRLSDRPRNPQQRATGLDLVFLNAMREKPSTGLSWEKDGSAVVRLPIVLNNPLCLQCHGGDEDIAEETRRVLAEQYPEDQATGYTMDELRGIWRITVPPAP